jgi:hypothetical protein
MSHLEGFEYEEDYQQPQLQEVFCLQRLDPWNEGWKTLEVYTDGEKADTVCEALNRWCEWQHRVTEEYREL